MEPMPLPLDGTLVGVVTVSDRCASGESADATGPVIDTALREAGATTLAAVVPDDIGRITEALRSAIAAGARAVITTGGTGIGPRDVTPEATAPLLERELPGIPELLRQRDAARTPLVALSRGLAGITPDPEHVIIVNLPGSPAAVASAQQVLVGIIAHALIQLDGGDH